MYPEDVDFPVFITTLSMLKTANPMLVVNFVKTEIVDPFGSKIQDRDESFFMEQDYTVRGDVETVWKYIEIITKLCTKALEV